MTRRDRLRKTVRAAVSDLVSNFLYYDRKEDEQLSREDIDEVFRKGYVTVDEVVRWFGEEMDEGAVPIERAVGNEGGGT